MKPDLGNRMQTVARRLWKGEEGAFWMSERIPLRSQVSEAGTSVAITDERSAQAHRGFCKIRRGLREHLGRMSSNAVKLYIFLHLAAFWKGQRRGTVEENYANIAKELHISYISLRRAIRELSDHYIRVEKRGNQNKPSVIRILNYDGAQVTGERRGNSAPITTEPSTSAPITGERSTERSEMPEAASGVGFSAPLEGTRSKAVEAAAVSPKREDSVWKFLQIQPCGPPSFRSLLQSRWISRNGPASVLIGETINVWEAAEGEKLNRCAPLFRALGELRRRKRANAASPSEEAHRLTAEELHL